MMTISNVLRTATTLRIGRCCRSLICLVAAVAIASFATPDAVAQDGGASPATAIRVAARTSGQASSASRVANAAGRSTEDHGQAFSNGIRPEDEITLINTRSICSCCDPEALRKELRVESYAVCDESGARHWQDSDLQAFLNFNSSVPTVIFVHGNQISPWDAKNEGVAVYRRMIAHGCDAPPIRFVIYSWPSSQISGMLRDVREKAARTGPSGCKLAWLIDQMPAETPLSLIGFSFGARIITGSLHILAGGSLGCGMELAEHVHPNRPQVSVIMMASAVHAHWLGDGQYHGLAMTQVSQMCLINNCDDLAMKYYDFIEPGCGGPQALGLCGPTRISAENARKIINRDVSRYVGDQHDLMRYVSAPGDAALIWRYTAGAAVEVGQSN
jgi:hypothetical protein